MPTLRNRLIRLAHDQPSLRRRLIPLLQKHAMQSQVGPGAEKKSWQAEFPTEVPCPKDGCDGTAELAFTSYEDPDGDSDTQVHTLKKQTGEPGGKWLHDSVAVAVYFCRTCLSPTAEWNQA